MLTRAYFDLCRNQVGLFLSLPIPSMYGIFTYIWLIFMVNVGKYSIHGWYGLLRGKRRQHWHSERWNRQNQWIGVASFMIKIHSSPFTRRAGDADLR